MRSLQAFRLEKGSNERSGKVKSKGKSSASFKSKKSNSHSNSKTPLKKNLTKTVTTARDKIYTSIKQTVRRRWLIIIFSDECLEVMLIILAFLTVNFQLWKFGLWVNWAKMIPYTLPASLRTQMQTHSHSDMLQTRLFLTASTFLEVRSHS